MTDARFPERWLNDRRILRLSSDAFRLFVVTLAWSVSNRTDGRLHPDDLGLMTGVDPGCADELVKADLWRFRRDEYVILDYLDTQTAKSQLDGLDRRRRLDADRAKRYRDRQSSRETSRDDKG